ncbi:MAG: VCBS repeat-containing protein [Flavobacteriales bacterium]|nr:MAG: VCBS repeat-containing protein [Flavobacteriales bacterium]
MRPTALILFSLAGCLSLTIQAQFGPGLTIAQGDVPGALRACDVDADGDPDLVRMQPGEGLAWLENADGAGGFNAEALLLAILESPTAWELEDLSGDGLPDLAYADPITGEVRWSLNAGPTFEAPVLLGQFPEGVGALALADLTGDGAREVVISVWDSMLGARLIMCANLGSGFGPCEAFGPAIAGAAPGFIRTGNMDLAGGIDLLIVDGDGQVVVVRNAAGDGTIWEPDTVFQPSGITLQAPSFMDVDGDGDLDLAEAQFPAVRWIENTLSEGGAWTDWVEHVLEPWTTAGPGSFGQLGCGEGAGFVAFPLNPDEPVRYAHWLTEIGAFAFSKAMLAFPRGDFPLLADFNGDGHDDLVLLVEGDRRLFINALQPSVEPLVLPELPALCKYGPEFNLPDAVPAGGRWTALAVFENQLLRSSIDGSGAYPLSHAAYAVEGCAIGGTTSILVVEQPLVEPPLSGELCSGQAPIQLTSVPPATAWVNAGPTGILDPSDFEGGVVVAVFTDATGVECATDIGPIAVLPSVPAQIAPAGPFCINSGPQLIAASAAPPEGVSWTGDIAGWNSAGATFIPQQAGTFMVVLLAEASAPNVCSASDTLIVVVSDSVPEIELQPVPVLCAVGEAIDLAAFATPGGGTWSGPGVTGSSFDPMAVGEGSYLVTYTVFEQGCGASEALALKLIEEVLVTASSEDLGLCPSDGPVVFTANPEGGLWSAPVSADGVFDPSVLAAGTYPVVYTWSGANGCTLVNDAFTAEVLICTGLGETDRLEARVWPVPFDHQLNLEVGASGAAAIDVLDAAGRLVLTTGPQPAGQLVVLPMASVRAGAYTVRLTLQDGGVRLFRALKE